MDPLQPNLPAIHGEAVVGSALLRKRIRVLAQDIQRNTFDLAEAFLEAQESRSFLDWGFESVWEYAAVDLGIKQRKAQYLAHIARVCREVGVARKDYEPAGVTPLRMITSLNPKDSFYNRETQTNESMVDHIVRLIAEAPELTTTEVEAEVARLKGQTGDDAMVHKGYSVTKSAYENVVKRCFESVRKRLGSKGRDGFGTAVDYTDGTCIEALCAEYNSDPRNFMEDPDESHEQIDIPTEETNDQAPNTPGIRTEI